LDDHPFSAGDISVNNRNFHFTAHLQIPIKITLDGTESFDFSGDDDVWVFLNDQLVLDIGGVHTALPGKFTINKDGGVTSTVSGKTTTINTNLKANQVVNLDFFYAERNTTEANTLITINNMNWPIIADSTLTAQISDNELIEYNASLTNRDTINNLDLTHLASHLSDDETEAGFLPLCYKSLFYTATPDDEDSWKPLALSMPSNTEQGFKLDTPLTLAPHGTSGDTMYFRYYVAPEKPTGQLQNVIAFRTYQNKYAGITYADAPITFANLDIPDSTPGTDTENPENPGDNTGNGTTDPIDPEDDTIADNEDDLYLPPLGEIIYVPQTGAITRSLSSLFASDNFATFILSQGFILANLAVFAVSFTIFYPLRRFL
jgi:fibro-slime domain-containing protein